MHSKENILEIVRRLEEAYPLAECTLDFEKGYQLLISVRLAAQCTDERVNKVTPALFEAYPSVEAFAAAEPADIEKYIHSCGFFRAKARDIVGAAKILASQYNGQVPDNMEELLKLPGVGRKTANLILGDLYGTPGAVVVDTHCIRLSNRLGLVDTKDPVKIETQLRKLIPSDKSSDFCHRLVHHGRAVCMARNPQCSLCTLRDLCSTGRKNCLK